MKSSYPEYPEYQRMNFIEIFLQIIQIWTKWWWLTWLIFSCHLPKKFGFLSFAIENVRKEVFLTQTFATRRILRITLCFFAVNIFTSCAYCLTRLIMSSLKRLSAVDSTDLRKVQAHSRCPLSERSDQPSQSVS